MGRLKGCAMSEFKTYTVGFYLGTVGADGKAGKVSLQLRDMAAGKCPAYQHGTVKYELRDLRAFGNGTSFSGVFARLRADDIPHIGSPGGPEREIDLERDEGLIEKNHFLYFREHEILVYQANRSGSSVNQLGRYFSDAMNETVAFHPVIQPDALQRLMRSNAEVKRVVVSVARPTNPDWYPHDNWSAQLINLLRDSDGGRLHIEISAEGRGARRKSLPEKIKRAVREIMGHAHTSVARFSVEENGRDHEIDLVADRITGKAIVEMNGRYPVPEKMFSALRESRDEQLNVLKEIFGSEGRALD